MSRRLRRVRVPTWLAAATLLVAAGLVIAYFRFVVHDAGTITTSAGPRWDAVRLVGERRLLLSFVGGPPTERPRVCAPTYSALAQETATEIVIRLRTREFHPRRSGGACLDVGHPRTIAVQLTDPVGNRSVRDGHTDEVKQIGR